MSDLIKVQASTAQLFFNSEEFMRDFVSPVHCAHPFNVIIEQLVCGWIRLLLGSLSSRRALNIAAAVI